MLENMIRVLTRYGGLFLVGLRYTLLLSAIAVVFGVVLGFILAVVKMSTWKLWGHRNPFSVLAGIYIDIIRGTPLLLQLYFFYFILPEVFPQFELSPFICISIALSANSSAYIAEVIRSGIQAVDRGQEEAARTLGMTKFQTMMHIIFPQAIRNILPALCNEFVTLIKETSLASTFFVGDLMTQFQVISGALYLTIEPLIIVGIIYLILTSTISKVVTIVERRMKRLD